MSLFRRFSTDLVGFANPLLSTSEGRRLFLRFFAASAPVLLLTRFIAAFVGAMKLLVVLLLLAVLLLACPLSSQEVVDVSIEIGDNERALPKDSRFGPVVDTLLHVSKSVDTHSDGLEPVLWLVFASSMMLLLLLVSEDDPKSKHPSTLPSALTSLARALLCGKHTAGTDCVLGQTSFCFRVGVSMSMSSARCSSRGTADFGEATRVRHRKFPCSKLIWTTGVCALILPPFVRARVLRVFAVGLVDFLRFFDFFFCASTPACT
jgi:hypothetical protein